jgi:hypothetical protein
MKRILTVNLVGIVGIGLLALSGVACVGTTEDSNEDTEQQSAAVTEGADCVACGMTITAYKPTFGHGGSEVYGHCYGRKAGAEVHVTGQLWLHDPGGGYQKVGGACPGSGSGFRNVYCSGPAIFGQCYHLECQGSYNSSGTRTVNSVTACD